MNVSVVIPTYNRTESLKRLLRSLSKQTSRLSEIIIVDAGPTDQSKAMVNDFETEIPVVYLTSFPSVCAQRNIGIRVAKSEWILLCDDDVEIPENYVSLITSYLNSRGDVGAASGRFMEENADGTWVYTYPIDSAWSLVWHFVFQWPLWCDLDQMQIRGLRKSLMQPIMSFYRKRGNTLSLAGWPINTQFKDPVFEAAIYSLGAAIIRRDWLLKFPFDEALDQFGIGDNYGVAINFEQPIHVLTDALAYHHRIQDNRMVKELSYFRRVLALEYFLKASDRFSWINPLFLVWSLIGYLLAQIKNQQMRSARVTLKALAVILAGRNPYSANPKQRSQTNPVY